MMRGSGSPRPGECREPVGIPENVAEDEHRQHQGNSGIARCSWAVHAGHCHGRKVTCRHRWQEHVDHDRALSGMRCWVRAAPAAGSMTPGTNGLPGEPRGGGGEYGHPRASRNDGEPGLEHSRHGCAHEDVKPVGVSFGIAAACLPDCEAGCAASSDKQHQHCQDGRKPWRRGHLGIQRRLSFFSMAVKD